jgi:hypothetical protein
MQPRIELTPDGERDLRPLLPVNTRINPETGRREIGTIPFEVNTLLRRNNRIYLVDKHCTQTRMKELEGLSDLELELLMAQREGKR